MAKILFLAIFCSYAFADESKTIRHGGRDRQYLLVTPPKPLDPAPLLIVLHGGDSDIAWMRTLTKKKFEKLAEEDGWLVVYPQGVNNVWNDGRWIDRPEAPMNRADDVGFIASLIDAVSRERAVDRSRVYVTGASNGGMMSHRIAIELSERIAAAAPVMAQIPAAIASRTRPARPVPILTVSGDEDPVVPHEGGHVHYLTQKLGEVISTAETARWWARSNGCGDPGDAALLPDADPKDETRTSVTRYPGEAPVVVYTVKGGGHTWPGGTQYLPKFAIGRTSRDFDAAAAIRDFFKEHRLVPRRSSEKKVFR